MKHHLVEFKLKSIKSISLKLYGIDCYYCTWYLRQMCFNGRNTQVCKSMRKKSMYLNIFLSLKQIEHKYIETFRKLIFIIAHVV